MKQIFIRPDSWTSCLLQFVSLKSNFIWFSNRDPKIMVYFFFRAYYQKSNSSNKNYFLSIRPVGLYVFSSLHVVYWNSSDFGTVSKNVCKKKRNLIGQIKIFLSISQCCYIFLSSLLEINEISFDFRTVIWKKNRCPKESKFLWRNITKISQLTSV